MSEIRLLGGRQFNLLERGTVTMSPAASAIYPPSRLYDGTSEWPARFGSLAVDSFVGVDLDLLRGSGNMDAWSGGLPTGDGWTKTGTVAEDTSTKYAGKSSAKASAGSLTITKWCRAGEKLRIDCYMRGDGTNAISLTIHNLGTGRFLTPGLAWSLTNQSYADTVVGSWANVAANPTIEGSAACRTDLVQIEITASNGAGNGWIDELTVVPYVDWCSVHGHNLDPVCVPKLRRAEAQDYSGAVDAATFSVKRRAFYAFLAAPVAARYWQAPKIVSTVNSAASGPVWMGEVILGQSIAVATGFEFPIETELDRAQVRLLSGSGGETTAAASAAFARRLTLRAIYNGRAAWDAMTEAIMEATQNGLYPLALAPEVGGDGDSDSDLVVFGRMANPVPLRRTQHLSRSVSLGLREFPFPLVV